MSRMRLSLRICFVLLLSGLSARGTSALVGDTLRMPDKIIRLPEVVSKDGDRAGTWGLPSLVALRYGLVVNDTLDERLSEPLSRQTAMRYLKDLYHVFGDWDQCLVAYLYSPAYVRSLQARNLDSIIHDFDAQRYAEQLQLEKAKKAALAKKAEIARKQANTAPPERHITYVVKRGDSLGKIAQKHHVTVNELKKWNNLKSDLIHENDKLKIYQ